MIWPWAQPSANAWVRKKGALKLMLKWALEQVAAGFPEGPAFEDGRVVDEDVEVGKMFPHAGDEGGRLLMIVEVATEQPALAAQSLDLSLGTCGRLRGGQVVKRDVVTVPRQCEGDGRADASGSAGDEGGSLWRGHGVHHTPFPAGSPPAALTVPMAGVRHANWSGTMKGRSGSRRCRWSEGLWPGGGRKRVTLWMRSEYSRSSLP